MKSEQICFVNFLGGGGGGGGAKLLSGEMPPSPPEKTLVVLPEITARDNRGGSILGSG